MNEIDSIDTDKNHKTIAIEDSPDLEKDNDYNQHCIILAGKR